MAEVKYCRDCTFARNKYQGEDNWKCGAPQNLSPHRSLVTGERIVIYPTAEQVRATACGPEGKWFLSVRDHQKQLSHGINYTIQSSSLKKLRVEDI